MCFTSFLSLFYAFFPLLCFAAHSSSSSTRVCALSTAWSEISTEFRQNDISTDWGHEQHENWVWGTRMMGPLLGSQFLFPPLLGTSRITIFSVSMLLCGEERRAQIISLSFLFFFFFCTMLGLGNWSHSVLYYVMRKKQNKLCFCPWSRLLSKFCFLSLAGCCCCHFGWPQMKWVYNTFFVTSPLSVSVGCRCASAQKEA